MAVVKELDRVLSGKVISGTGGSFHRNLDHKWGREWKAEKGLLDYRCNDLGNFAHYCKCSLIAS
jgi:hypothetical protein